MYFIAYYYKLLEYSSEMPHHGFKSSYISYFCTSTLVRQTSNIGKNRPHQQSDSLILKNHCIHQLIIDQNIFSAISISKAKFRLVTGFQGANQSILNFLRPYATFLTTIFHLLPRNQLWIESTAHILLRFIPDFLLLNRVIFIFLPLFFIFQVLLKCSSFLLVVYNWMETHFFYFLFLCLLFLKLLPLFFLLQRTVEFEGPFIERSQFFFAPSQNLRNKSQFFLFLCLYPIFLSINFLFPVYAPLFIAINKILKHIPELFLTFLTSFISLQIGSCQRVVLSFQSSFLQLGLLFGKIYLGMILGIEDIVHEFICGLLKLFLKCRVLLLDVRLLQLLLFRFCFVLIIDDLIVVKHQTNYYLQRGYRSSSIALQTYCE